MRTAKEAMDAKEMQVSFTSAARGGSFTQKASGTLGGSPDASRNFVEVEVQRIDLLTAASGGDGDQADGGQAERGWFGGR